MHVILSHKWSIFFWISTLPKENKNNSFTPKKSVIKINSLLAFKQINKKNIYFLPVFSSCFIFFFGYWEVWNHYIHTNKRHVVYQQHHQQQQQRQRRKQAKKIIVFSDNKNKHKLLLIHCSSQKRHGAVSEF